MNVKFIVLILALLTVIVGCADSGKQLSEPALTPEPPSDIERGRYVVSIMGCNDCHTPGYMRNTDVPEEDWLVGETLGFYSASGTVYPTNLRLLLDSISEEDWLIVAKKLRKDSPMTWVMLPKASDQDLRAIYRFVRYLGPKGTQAPPSLPAGAMPETLYMEYPNPHRGEK